jgi:hypothetical protein
MNATADIEQSHASIERLEELIQLIDILPMRGEFIQTSCEVGLCGPEALAACGSGGILDAA